MATYTVGYFCYLCHDKNVIVKQKTELLREAQEWKSFKHIGKADICFMLYEDLKYSITAKTEHIKTVGKFLKAKPVYGQDYSILAIEMRGPGNIGYQTVAENPARIQELAEQYIIESIVLGNYDDKP